MAKMTIELPDELKRCVEDAAKLEHRTEDEIIRDAIDEAMWRKRVPRTPRPKPTIPLTTKPLGRPDVAERVDEYLKGFGED